MLIVQSIDRLADGSGFIRDSIIGGLLCVPLLLCAGVHICLPPVALFPP